MARAKRDPGRRDAAQLLLGCGMLSGVSPGQMNSLYVDALIEAEKKRLIAGGCPPEAAERLAEDARASERNYRRDSLQMREGLSMGKAKAGEALILHRIEELTTLWHKVKLIQAECWRQFELGADDVGTEDRTEVKEPVEVEDAAKIDEKTGDPLTRRVLKTQRVTTRLGSRTSSRASNAVWISQIGATIAQELEISEKIFKLSAALDLPPELPADLQALAARKDAAAAYAMQQAEYLGRALTRVQGRPDPSLVRLIMAALGGKPVPPAEPPGDGFDGTEEEDGMRVRIIEVQKTELPS